MNNPKWKPIKNFINGTEVGFENTQLGVDFINHMRKEIYRKYDFDILGVESVFTGLHARGIQAESFEKLKKRKTPDEKN